MKKKAPQKSRGLETRDQFTVVVEDIRSKLKGVAEGVMMVNEKMDREFGKIDERFNKVDDKFGKIDERFNKVDDKFGKMDERFNKVDENLRLMRTEISLIRHNQITRDEFKALEDRVFTIEKKISK